MIKKLSHRTLVFATIVVVSIARIGIAKADETINACGGAPNEVFAHGAVFGINTFQNCQVGAGAYLEIANAGNAVAAGQRASWQATAPAGLLIKDVTIPVFRVNGINDGKQYGGGFYWHAGGVQVHDGAYSAFAGVDAGDGGFPSPYFGLQVICGANPCTADNGYFFIQQAQLDVIETSGPWLSGGGLWDQPGWIRSDWPVSVTGDSPSGVCALSAAIDGQPVAGRSFSQDTSAWHQCNAAGAGGMSSTVHTNQFSNASHQLVIYGSDAAGLNTGSAYTTTIHVDNSTPTIALAGPVDVPSTAGTQYVTATAGGSASGIAEIDCRVDSGPWQRFPEGGAQQATAQVPVSGLGEHSTVCAADNTAVAQDGSHGWSTQASSALKIGEPTVSAISFAKIINGLRCHRVRKRVRVPAHWVTVRRHRKLVRVHRRAHTKTVKVTRCDLRVVRRRITVWVTIHRHGKKVRVKRRKVIRVAVPPRVVSRTTMRIRHGHGATISGWLGTAGGVALGGQTVRVVTAPDNGLGQFALVALATTAANGAWTAALPAGPSRLVEAVYDGAPTTESSISGQVRLIVPAKVKITISPRIVPWGSKIRITGRVLGGYVTPNSNLLRLNVGIGRIGQLVGLPEIQPDGRFLIVWKFDPGHGVLHPWFSVGTLSESNFPWAPATSKRIVVTLGKRTPVSRHRHRRHNGRRRHPQR